MKLAVEYIVAVCRYWYALAVGLIAGIIGIAKDYFDLKIDVPSEALWTIGIGSVFVAQFLAYRELWVKFKAYDRPKWDMEVLDLLELAPLYGWDWVGGYQHWDLQEALHDAACNGELTVWGRQTYLARPPQPAPLVPIAIAFWADLRLDLQIQMDGNIGRDNRKTAAKYWRDSRQNFSDLHLSRAQVVLWLKGRAKQFMGNMRRGLAEDTLAPGGGNSGHLEAPAPDKQARQEAPAPTSPEGENGSSLLGQAPKDSGSQIGRPADA